MTDWARVLIAVVLVSMLGWCCAEAPAGILDDADVTLPAEDDMTLPFDFNSGVYAVGVQGNLSDVSDSDRANFTAPSGSSMHIGLENLASGDNPITALDVDVDGRAVFVVDNDLWRENASGDFVLLASQEQFVSALGLPAGTDLQVSDIAIGTTDTVYVAFRNRGDLVTVTVPGAVEWRLAHDTVLDATGEDTVDIVSISIDEDFSLFLADNVSGSVLLAWDNLGTYYVAQYNTADALGEAIERDVRASLQSGGTPIPRASVADAGAAQPFWGNSLLLVESGDYGPPLGGGDSIFYVTQLGPSVTSDEGDGSITSIVPNAADPSAASFSAFFSPTPAQENLNPSALALDTSGAFDNHLIMGTFGPDLGNEEDGAVFEVDTEGAISPLASGFYDVTDLAFGPGGDWGTDLYVLSENAGTYSSDIWQVDPSGDKSLFSDDVVDGGISLAFDTTASAAYDGDLFVTSYENARIYRIDETGTKTLFYDFSIWSDYFQLCDLVFFPENDEFGELQGLMGASIRFSRPGNPDTLVVTLDPNVVPGEGAGIQYWAFLLDGSDVSSNDLAVQDNGGLFILQSEDKSIVQIQYEDIFKYDFIDLQMRPVQGTLAVPYMLMETTEQPRIVRLSDLNEPCDIVTEVSPSQLDISLVDDHIAYTFDSSGDLFFYFQFREQLIRNSRNDELGIFPNQTVELFMRGSTIEDELGLVDVQVPMLVFDGEDNLFGVGNNGEGSAFFSGVLGLGNAADEDPEPALLFSAEDSGSMTVTVSGPDIDASYEVAGGLTLETDPFEGLVGGSYDVTVSEGQGNYNLLVAFEETIVSEVTVSEGNSPYTFTTASGQSWSASMDGSGEADITFELNGSGQIERIDEIAICGTSAASSFELTMSGSGTPSSLVVDEVVLCGSVGDLVCEGTVLLLRPEQEAGAGQVSSLQAGVLGSVEAPNYRFPSVTVGTLGQASTQHHFWASSLTSLHAQTITGPAATETVYGYEVLTPDSRNRFSAITIDGTATNCRVFGGTLETLTVHNTAGADVAMSGCYVYMGSPGFIRNVQIMEGDVQFTAFIASLMFGRFQAPDVDSDLINVDFRAAYSIDTVYVGGSIDINCSISTILSGEGGSSVLSIGRVGKVISGGDNGATIQTSLTFDVLAGYNLAGQPVREDSDFLGQVQNQIYIGKIAATGQIVDSTIACFVGIINTIIAEDGIENTSINTMDPSGQVPGMRPIIKIMVGLENGNTSQIGNDDADIVKGERGEINANLLAMLYYTGELDPTLTLPAVVGREVDLVP